MNQIRGEPVERAREILRYSEKRAAYLLDRVLLSALGNADSKSSGRVGAAELIVADVYCDEAQRLKRWKAGPKGGVRPIVRRLAHLTVVLAEKTAPGGETPAPEQKAAAEKPQKAPKKAAKKSEKKSEKKTEKKAKKKAGKKAKKKAAKK